MSAIDQKKSNTAISPLENIAGPFQNQKKIYNIHPT